MSRILLVEDDPVLGRGLLINLELENYETSWARSLGAASQIILDERFDLVILDLGLPDGNGLSFCTQMRKNKSKVPIIMLTAQADENSVVEGLQAGANDYVRKPFGNRELLARIKTALREPIERESGTKYGDLLIHLEQRRVLFGAKEIDLNRREFDIFSYLIERADAVVTRDTLLSHLGLEGEIYDRTIDSHLSHVRAKLRNAGAHSVQISTIYGVGYRLEEK